MKPNAQPGDAMAKLGEAIQTRSLRIENGDLGANVRDRRFTPPCSRSGRTRASVYGGPTLVAWPCLLRPPKMPVEHGVGMK